MTKTYEERLRDMERFHLRDLENKEILLKFRTVGAASEYQHSMRFGLGGYYEIFDSRTGEVVKPKR